jgi:hypothetical protein
MKKLICILVLGLLLSGTAYAEISAFNRWLYQNGHYDLVEKVENENMILYKNKYEIYTYPERYWIPEENAKPKPNYITLLHEFYKYSEWTKPKVNKISIKKSEDPYEFKFNITKNKYDKHIDKALNQSGLLSYLYFENDEVLIDKISPENRFGKFLKKDTMYKSHSVGKSIVSYIMGHAICEGYIEGVDSKVNDWPILENTLYHNQKLINLLNFRAGDQKYTWDYYFINPKFFKNNENRDIETLLNYEFQNSKKSREMFNYSSFLASLIFNYIVFKTETDQNFEDLLNKIFRDKVKIEHEFLFRKVGGAKLQGHADNRFYATRYDYLRVAKAMLDDWQKDTCVGKYLKTIFERQKKKDGIRIQAKWAKSYAGMFQTNYEFIPKKRPVMGMHGYGGQHVVIDFENSRIVVANSIHENWDWKKIIYSKIRKGID